MRRFVLDTNIFIAYARRYEPLINRIEQDLHLLADPSHVVMLSVVTEAECISFALKHQWGVAKVQTLKSMVRKFPVIDIHSASTKLLDVYAEIDAFSEFKLAKRPTVGGAIHMGKNDLWIAATAHIFNAELVTTDADFDHLQGEYLSVHRF